MSARVAGSLLTALGSVLALGAAWWLAAPVQLGGRSTYVITRGVSMEPRYHQGDLVVARRSTTVDVGDVIAFRNPRIGIVLHRVVAISDGTVTTQGDNNDYLDDYQPLIKDVLGEQAVHIPFIGRVLDLGRRPQSVAILVALLGVLVVGITGNAKRVSRRNRKAGGDGDLKAGHREPASEVGGVPAVMLALSAFMVCLLASLLLAFLAFRRPETRAAAKNVTFEQAAAFSYTAASRSGVYDSEAAQTGDPVFIRLSETVDVTVQYRFAAQEPHAVTGNYRVVARLSSDNGWRRTLPLTPKTDFSGNGFKAQVPVKISELQYTIAATEHETGVTGRSYKVAIIPEVELTGTLAGQELREKFSPALTFTLDALQLTVERPATETPRVTGASSAAAADPFKPVQKGFVQRPGTKPNTLPILFLDPRVHTARLLSLGGLALAAVLGAAAGWLALRARRADEPARIQSRYAPLMLKVAEGDPAAGTRVVRVASIDDLVKVAGSEGRLILHKNGGLAHRYFVADGELVYEYATQSRPPVAAAVNGVQVAGPGEGSQGNGAGRSGQGS